MRHSQLGYGYGRLRAVTGGYGRLRLEIVEILEIPGILEISEIPSLVTVTGGQGRSREVTGGYGRLREATGGYG